MFDNIRADIAAVRDRDPAARSAIEIFFLYPGLKAVRMYRRAHWFYKHKCYFLARLISQRAVRKTGIEIHPGAKIGKGLFIDHGTGVVIGATSIIGNHVKLYQGVTLGAKSFPLDAQGNPIKGIDRHPILEDNVIVYSNSTILGRITIGHDAIIGGNVWVTEDVAPNAKVLQRK